MPINISNLNAAKQPHMNYTPKWFSEDLTGAGNNTGLLNSQLSLFTNQPPNGISFGNRREKIRKGDYSHDIIPTSLLNAHFMYAAPDAIKLSKLGSQIDITDSASKATHVTAELSIVPSDVVISKKDAPTVTTLHVTYTAYLYITKNHQDPLYRVRFDDDLKTGRADQHNRLFILTNYSLPDIIDALTLHPHVDHPLLMAYVNSLKIYDMLVGRVRYFTEDIGKEAIALLQAKERLGKSPPFNETLIRYFQTLEHYHLPLHHYRDIYQALIKSSDTEFISAASKSNLNLLMNNIMEDMKHQKASLKTVPNRVSSNTARFSKEQKNAVLGGEPLTLVQAGAGTGKSTTILGRMEHMFAQGINPEDVLVLSFTNAAANNILEKQPLVKSSTIASVVHEIYQENFPNHKLSNIDTIINSLEIYYKDDNDDLISEFARHLHDIKKHKANGFTELNLLLDVHLSMIIDMLDEMKQTCMELEILILYQMMATFKEPADIKPKHIIMDEVQDTSIFEFIFILNYTLKKGASLYIVGDPSQTLYEFRNSNPKAISTLETSDIFDTYILSTNYRSNQAILDFANVALADIEANAHAKIQLQSNLLHVGDAFENKVQFLHTQVSRKADILSHALESTLKSEIKAWATPIIAKGEQIAFLAHTRRYVSLIEKVLEELYPNKTISNLMPKKPYTNTIISRYIKLFWDNTDAMDVAGFLFNLKQDILKKAPDLSWSKTNAHTLMQVSAGISRDIDHLILKHAGHFNHLESLVLSGKMPRSDYITEVRDLLLDYEIKKNSVKFRLQANENAASKDTRGDLVVSTIHSAKGLEFPHTCVIYTAGNTPSEEDKRMFYVAFTRAMQSTLIASFDKVKRPILQKSYDDLVVASRNSPVYQVNPLGRGIAKGA